MKENIEEVIEFLQGFNDGYTFQQCQTCFKFNEKDGCYNKEKCEELEAINFLISDYKKVLKENEELLQEKIDNQKIIALAQNEFLGYEQGYQDGKAGRGSAVQAIIEGQQYYIIQKQIERYKNQIEKLQKENEELKNKLLDIQRGGNKMREYKYFVSFCQGVSARDTIGNSIITFGKKNRRSRRYIGYRKSNTQKTNRIWRK